MGCSGCGKRKREFHSNVSLARKAMQQPTEKTEKQRKFEERIKARNERIKRRNAMISARKKHGK